MQNISAILPIYSDVGVRQTGIALHIGISRGLVRFAKKIGVGGGEVVLSDIHCKVVESVVVPKLVITRIKVDHVPDAIIVGSYVRAGKALVKVISILSNSIYIRSPFSLSINNNDLLTSYCTPIEFNGRFVDSANATSNDGIYDVLYTEDNAILRRNLPLLTGDVIDSANIKIDFAVLGLSADELDIYNGWKIAILNGANQNTYTYDGMYGIYKVNALTSGIPLVPDESTRTALQVRGRFRGDYVQTASFNIIRDGSLKIISSYPIYIGDVISIALTTEEEQLRGISPAFREYTITKIFTAYSVGGNNIYTVSLDRKLSGTLAVGTTIYLRTYPAFHSQGAGCPKNLLNIDTGASNYLDTINMHPYKLTTNDDFLYGKSPFLLDYLSNTFEEDSIDNTIATIVPVTEAGVDLPARQITKNSPVLLKSINSSALFFCNVIRGSIKINKEKKSIIYADRNNEFEVTKELFPMWDADTQLWDEETLTPVNVVWRVNILLHSNVNKIEYLSGQLVSELYPNSPFIRRFQMEVSNYRGSVPISLYLILPVTSNVSPSGQGVPASLLRFSGKILTTTVKNAKFWFEFGDISLTEESPSEIKGISFSVVGRTESQWAFGGILHKPIFENIDVIAAKSDDSLNTGKILL